MTDTKTHKSQSNLQRETRPRRMAEVLTQLNITVVIIRLCISKVAISLELSDGRKSTVGPVPLVVISVSRGSDQR